MFGVKSVIRSFNIVPQKDFGIQTTKTILYVKLFWNTLFDLYLICDLNAKNNVCCFAPGQIDVLFLTNKIIINYLYVQNVQQLFDPSGFDEKFHLIGVTDYRVFHEVQQIQQNAVKSICKNQHFCIDT